MLSLALFFVSVSGQRSSSIPVFFSLSHSLMFVFLMCPGSVCVTCCYIGWIPWVSAFMCT